MGFLDGSSSKESACDAGDTGDEGSIPGSEDPLEEEMATHSRILVWKIPWTEDPGRLQPMGLQRVSRTELMRDGWMLQARLVYK